MAHASCTDKARNWAFSLQYARDQIGPNERCLNIMRILCLSFSLLVCRKIPRGSYQIGRHHTQHTLFSNFCMTGSAEE